MLESTNPVIETLSDGFGAPLLNQTARQLSEEIPLVEALERTMRFVVSALKCDSCAIYSLEEKRLVLSAAHNPPPRVTNQLKVKVVQDAVGWGGKKYSIVAVEERACEDPRARLFNEFILDRFETFLSLPLLSAGRLVGVLNALNWARLPLDKSDLQSIATIGFLAGNAIERARLEKENSLLVERLETRKVVERAKAILQSKLQISEEDAYRTMQLQSQAKNKSMKEIAKAVILSSELQNSSLEAVS